MPATAELSPMQIGRARAYVNKIRNERKRWYAAAVMSYMLRWTQTRPASPDGLSVMAAQAVRMELASIIGDAGQ